MDINQLRYFLEICSSGSMSKAAAALNISPQGISASIRRLEDELAADLFYRGANGLSLTELGKSVKSEAQIIVQHVDRIYELSNLEATGKTNITIAMTRGRFIKLPASLQNLLLTPPDEFSVNIINDYSTICTEMVLNDQAVFGMVYGNCSQQKFNVTLLEDVQQVFVVSKRHPLAGKSSVSIHELDNMPMLMPGLKTKPGMAIAEMFSKNNVRLNTAAYDVLVPHQAIDIAAANENLVARTLLSDVTEADLEKISVLTLEDCDFTMPFSLIYRKDRKLSVHEQLFKHLILDCCRGR